MNLMQQQSFSHSGDLGDIIFSLPAIKAQGGGKLYLDTTGGIQDPLVKWADKKRTKLNPERATQLCKILNRQPYLEAYTNFGVREGAINLNQFRQYVRFHNLADSHLAIFDTVDINKRNEPWLIWDNDLAKKKWGDTIVLSRSVRYHSNYSFWESFLPTLKGHKVVFVGLEKEHNIFEYTFGHKIPFYRTDTLSELMDVVSSCKILITNENFPRALREGLKLPMMVEVYRVSPGGMFEREGVSYF